MRNGVFIVVASCMLYLLDAAKSLNYQKKKEHAHNPLTFTQGTLSLSLSLYPISSLSYTHTHTQTHTHTRLKLQVCIAKAASCTSPQACTASLASCNHYIIILSPFGTSPPP